MGIINKELVLKIQECVEFGKVNKNALCIDRLKVAIFI